MIDYFAYGSNLWLPRMRARVPSVTVAGRSTLRGFRLVFRKRGADGSAKADIAFTGRRGDRVEGVLYRLAAHDLPRLDRAEPGYCRATVFLDKGMARKWALTYVAASPAQDPFPPFVWYRDLVLAGGRLHALDETYLRAVAAVPALPDPDPVRHARNRPDRWSPTP